MSQISNFGNCVMWPYFYQLYRHQLSMNQTTAKQKSKRINNSGSHGNHKLNAINHADISNINILGFAVKFQEQSDNLKNSFLSLKYSAFSKKKKCFPKVFWIVLRMKEEKKQQHFINLTYWFVFFFPVFSLYVFTWRRLHFSHKLFLFCLRGNFAAVVNNSFFNMSFVYFR